MEELTLDHMMNRQENLNSLEYAGLEYTFQRIIHEYENRLQIPVEYQTSVSAITRRLPYGLEIFSYESNGLYIIEGFAIRNIIVDGSVCAIVGFFTNGRVITGCYDDECDTVIDITPFLDEASIDIDWLISKIKQ
jgi:hypothetical protein